MTDKDVSAVPAALDKDARLAEIDGLTRKIRELLDRMADQMEAGEDIKPADLSRRIGDLHAAHLKLLEQERVFHAKLGHDDDAQQVDYDAMRADIGRILDRIRASHGAGGLS